MTLRTIWLISKKELKSLGAEKTIILAILLQLFIALFSSFLMIGLSAMYDPDAYTQVSGLRFGVGYTGEDSDLYRLIAENPNFKPYKMNLSEAVQALQERKLAAVVNVPEIKPDQKESVLITMYILRNDIQSAVIEVKLKDIFIKFEDKLRNQWKNRLDYEPVKLRFARPVAGSTFYEFIYGLLIPLLLFMPAIISAGLVIDQITEEYQQKTIDTILSTPVSLQDLIFGKILACVILIPIQTIVWLVLLTGNGIQIGHLGEILLHVISASTALILIAALTALYYDDRTKAQFIFSTGVVILLLLGLSFPGNPFNQIALLASGAGSSFHWIMLMASLSFCVLLIAGVRILVRRRSIS